MFEISPYGALLVKWWGLTAILHDVRTTRGLALGPALMTSPRTTIFRTSPFASWTRKVEVGLGMSGNALYVSASVCINDRIRLS